MNRYTAPQVARVSCVMDTTLTPAYALLMERAGARLFYTLGEPLEVDSSRDVDAIPDGHPFMVLVSADAVEELIEWADQHTENEDVYGALMDIWMDVQDSVYC